MDRNISDEVVSSAVFTRVYPDGRKEAEEITVLREHSLVIRIRGGQDIGLTCSKEHLKELVAGRLLTDGMIGSADDIEELSFSKDEREAFVTLAGSAKKRVPAPFPKTQIRPDRIFDLAERFARDTAWHRATGAAHSCMLAGEDKVLFAAEDIGRHNAIDKVAGYGILNRIHLDECMIYTSGRAPLDMVKKAVQAGIPVMISKASPTAEAIEYAGKMNLTLICRTRPEGFLVIAD